MSALRNYCEDVRKRYKIRRYLPQFWRTEELGLGYLQIPKVASQSVRETLYRMDEAVVERSGSFDDFDRRRAFHLTQAEVRRQISDGLYVFALVRHPLARLYSAWSNKVSRSEGVTRRNIFSCHGIHDHMPFPDFVRRVRD